MRVSCRSQRGSRRTPSSPPRRAHPTTRPRDTTYPGRRLRFCSSARHAIAATSRRPCRSQIPPPSRRGFSLETIPMGGCSTRFCFGSRRRPGQDVCREASPSTPASNEISRSISWIWRNHADAPPSSAGGSLSKAASGRYRWNVRFQKLAHVEGRYTQANFVAAQHRHVLRGSTDAPRRMVPRRGSA